MASFFKRQKRTAATADEAGAASEREQGQSRQASANEAYRHASDERARAQAVANEAARRASDERARAQTSANEAHRVASDASARQQAAENEAGRGRRGDAPPQ
jgi:hypothetical protein